MDKIVVAYFTVEYDCTLLTNFNKVLFYVRLLASINIQNQIKIESVPVTLWWQSVRVLNFFSEAQWP